MEQFTDYDWLHDVAKDGDNAIFRNGGMIGRTGYSDATHVGKLYWYRRTLMLAECREWFGGRTVTLHSQVQKYPGRIDILRPKCSIEAAYEGAEMMCRQAGHPYGVLRIVGFGLMRLPVMRVITGYRGDIHDLTPSGWYEPKVCSQSVIWSERKGAERVGDKFFPLAELGDKWCLPEHIQLATGDYVSICKGLVDPKFPVKH